MQMPLQRNLVRPGQATWLFSGQPHHSSPASYTTLENAVRQLFSRKGDEVVGLNLKALSAGRTAAGR